ncbi:MAG: glycosyltransferase family 25 protein [Ferruginibacter sp.]
MNIPADICKELQQFFDKVLVVSVPRFTDRHQRVQERLRGLAFDFFWGADKLKLDMEAVKQDGTYDEATAIKLERLGKPLSAGELACALSHQYVYAAMIENGWERILILEDDVWPLYSNMPLIKNAIHELPREWDLLYFGYLKHEKITFGLKFKRFFYKMVSSFGLIKWNYTMAANMLPGKYSRHLKKAGFHDCTHAYAITLEGAKKLLKAQTPVVYRADDLLSYTILKGNFTAFLTDPKFFDQEDFHSGEVVSKVKEAH